VTLLAGPPRHALLVCSNDIHVAMFGPVVGELAALGVPAILLSLDSWYGQDATAAAAKLGARIVELPRDRPLEAGRFYRRPTPVIWLDVLRARRPVRTLLDQVQPTVVVVGNDRGLLEKLILARARERDATTVLVQDGHLVAQATPDAQVLRRIWRRARRWASAVVRRVGSATFAATAYGTWGCDLVCASGPEGAEALLARGVPKERLIITGQPRYDRAIAEASQPPGRGAVWFTTPFEAQNLGDEPQRRQEQFVEETAVALEAAGIPFAVKPHPREDPRRYDHPVQALSGRGSGATPAEALADAELAIIGISSVTDEAVLAGVPVVVPGARIHGRAFERLLPDAAAFPRVETGQDIRQLIEDLRAGRIDRAEILARQAGAVSRRLSVDADAPAARRVALAIANGAG
jgi:hypothetical protein